MRDQIRQRASWGALAGFYPGAPCRASGIVLNRSMKSSRAWDIAADSCFNGSMKLIADFASFRI